MEEFPEPMEGSVFYEDDKIYACLAFHPIMEGHTIVVWRKKVRDLTRLNREDCSRLMEVVCKIREALMVVYEVSKVYVAYLDEIQHVHVHLFPRREDGEKGFGVMAQPHGELTDLSIVPRLRILCLASLPR